MTSVMDGVLLSPLQAASANADLSALVTRLLAEVDQLRAEVADLRRENLQLRQQAGYWQSRHADAVRRIAALEQENAQLRGENRKLQAERFGRRSEKQSGSDRSNELEDPTDTKPKRQRVRQPLSLPVNSTPARSETQASGRFCKAYLGW
jgi:chromosome segregation ATPase